MLLSVYLQGGKMFEIFKGFIVSIIVYNFFAVCCESIIAGEKYKKIYSFFSGLIVITIVISFIFRIKGVSVSDIFCNEFNNSVIDELQIQIDKKVEDISGDAKDCYKSVIEGNIEKYICEQGYSVNSIDIKIKEDRIYAIEISMGTYSGISEKTDNNRDKFRNSGEICQVKDVYVGNIEINSGNTEQQEDVSDEKSITVDKIINNEQEPIINKIKQELSIIYGLDMEDVYIVLMEE